MEVNIFILCYNESALLPHTINHYKKYIPSCKITIYDNESTDNSVELAKSFGCDVVAWNSNNIIDDFKYREIKNKCWKHVQRGWILMIDMDEFLCVTEDELIEEMKNGTSVLSVDGKNMIGESKTLDLTDIDLQKIKKYYDCSSESKNLCFLREKITEMNYGFGAHYCNPQGIVNYSSKLYINKHMSWLGLTYLQDKILQRYVRSEFMRSNNMATHYTDNMEQVMTDYCNALNGCKLFN